MSEEEKQEETAQDKPQKPPIPWAKFLEEYPTGSVQEVSGFWYRETIVGVETGYWKSTPMLRLYCGQCKGVRNFDGKWERTTDAARQDITDDFLLYTCRDCKVYVKHYCLRYDLAPDGNGIATKIGEYPGLNIDIPPSLPKLLGTDYLYFIKGLKCEKQGLGVGAYTYYRRVVENQMSRMLEKILEVAQKLHAKTDTIEAIRKATHETQFSKAVDTVKGMLPESLLIDGHNPFKLIHKALSIGIHNEKDETCLELAHNVRLVLTDLAERITTALSEQRELKSATSNLMKFNREHT